MTSPPADSGWALAHEMERRSRTEQPRRTPEAKADIAAARAAPTGLEIAMREVDRAVEQAAREDRACAHAVRHIGCPSCDERRAAADRDIADLANQPNRKLDGLLSNAALADTPAVREMGGPAPCPTVARVIRGSIEAGRTPGGNITLDTTHTVGGLLRSIGPFGSRPWIEIERADLDDAIAALQVLAGTPPPGEVTPVLPPDAIVLTGPEAERYRALQVAARKAHASALAAQADSAALRDAFHAMCVGFTPGMDG